MIETLKRLAKLRAKLDASDPRVVSLVALLRLALEQRNMSSTGRLGRESDDMEVLKQSLETLRMNGCAEYAELCRRIEDEDEDPMAAKPQKPYSN